METLIFGHKNPDTDSITSTLALSNLKHRLGYKSIPYMLGDTNKETEYVLNCFQCKKPRYISNVKTQVKDLNYDKIPGVSSFNSILYAYKLMEENDYKLLPVLNSEKKLLGIVSMKDIAMSLIKGDLYKIHTTIDNIVNDLKGEIIYANRSEIEGCVSVLALYYKTLMAREHMNKNTIVIVGDRLDIIDYVIECGVQLIILTCNSKLPQNYIQRVKEKGVSLIRVPQDTYTTSRLINQCNFISSIMISKDIILFKEDDYLDDVKEEILNKNHTNYPIIDKKDIYLGMMNKKHLLHPDKKEVILVDHNEYSQSATGLNEANILEIIDHHKLGDISTTLPIYFRNMPVGSTCTIIYNMYLENGVKIDQKIAGLLISGILSDTLAFKSPTTTDYDRKAVEGLNKILNLNIEEYAMKMFKAGSSLEGQSIEEIFNKDYKSFEIDGQTLGVAQVFTMDIDEVLARKNEFLNYMKTVHDKKNHSVTLLIITDIIKEGSYLLYQCDPHNLVPTAFVVEEEQGVFVKGIVSRKKQVMPKLIQQMNLLK